MSVKRGIGGGRGLDPAALAKIEKSIADVQESAVAVSEAVKETTEATAKFIEESAERHEAAAALLSLSFRAQVKADRSAGAGIITDALILQSADIVDYPEWAAGVVYEKGDILKSKDGLLFEVVANHTSNKAYPLETTFAYYRLIELVKTGTKDEPIPYPETAGIVVNVVNGKYYSYKNKLYLAKADMPNCVYPPDTAGLWQWEAVK